MIESVKENLVTQVLDRLSKLEELPKEGFLCGGSVANTILSIIDGKDYPINDLDIFNIDKETSHSNAPIRIDDNDITSDRYENRAIIPSSSKGNYRITTTHYNGLINYVYVYFSYVDGVQVKDQYQMILNSFDINCCKVGIDLSTNTLFLTKDFVDFIHTRQIECVNPTTPGHTAIRVLKKRDDLNAFLNKDDVFKFLSQFYNYNNNVINNRLNLTLFFGKKYKDLFHKYENELNEYFELWSYAKTRKYYANLHKKEYEMYSTNNTEIKTKDGEFVMVKVPNWVFTFNYTEQHFLDKWYETKLWALIPKKYNTLDSEIEKYYRPELGTNPNIIKRLWELIYKQNKKQKNKSLKLLSVKEFYPFVIVNDDFHNCDFSDVNIEKLVKFVEENPSFCNLMTVSKLNFQESEKLMNMVKKLFPQELELFCDLISKELYDEKYFNKSFDTKKILDQEYVTNKYNMVKTILSKELTNKIDLSDFEYNTVIKELICPLDLLWAGKYMHNCLKGYNENGFHYRIERGEIRIFIISDDTERTALQISKTYSNTYKIDQIYGHSNTDVCVKHKMIADYLIRFLEYQHYLFESQKIIQLFKSDRVSLIEKINDSDYGKYSHKNKMFEPHVIEPIVDMPRLMAVTINDTVPTLTPDYLYPEEMVDTDIRDQVYYENDDCEDYD